MLSNGADFEFVSPSTRRRTLRPPKKPPAPNPFLRPVVLAYPSPYPSLRSLSRRNGCGNLKPKVPLTVSPFRPFLLPQPRVYLQPSDFVDPLFSWSYELLSPQPLCSDKHLRCPGVWGSAPSKLCVLCGSALKRSLSLFPATHTENAPVTPLPATHTKNALSQVLSLPHIQKHRGVGVGYG